MRSIIVIMVTFFFSIMSMLSILTIDSYVLQKDEIERALDFALEQTMQESVSDPDEMALKAVEKLQSQINSSRGTLTVYVLHADKNIVDVAVSFVYTQYNGTKKEIESRKTIIKDWEEGKEEEAIIRMIGEEYLEKTPENGGLKRNSVWKTDILLRSVFRNEKVDGKWKTVQFEFSPKTEIRAN